MAHTGSGTIRTASATTAKLAALASAACAIAPTQAYATGWDVSDEANAVGATQDAARSVQAPTISTVFGAVTNWVAGIAVAIFVLRVAMTAIDRMVLSGQHGWHAFKLSEIPFIGAYPDPDDIIEMDEANANAYAAQHGHTKRQTLWTWRRIWKRFALQIGIVAGIWAIMRILLGITVMIAQQTGISA